MVGYLVWAKEYLTCNSWRLGARAGWTDVELGSLDVLLTLDKCDRESVEGKKTELTMVTEDK